MIYWKEINKKIPTQSYPPKTTNWIIAYIDKRIHMNDSDNPVYIEETQTVKQ